MGLLLDHNQQRCFCPQLFLPALLVSDFFLFWLGLVLGGQGNWGRICPLKNAFFQFSKIPYLAKRREKAFVFWGEGNFLSNKCALQCLLSLAPIRGWSVLLIEVWKSLFWCKISGSFLFCKSQSFYKNNFSVCKKCSQNSLNLGAQKFSAFLANFYPN